MYNERIVEQVYAFGSRARWTAKKHSDLDLVVRCHEPLTLKCLGSLQEAFAESDLPMRVDVVDWQIISDRFRQLIEQDCVAIWTPELVR